MDDDDTDDDNTDDETEETDDDHDDDDTDDDNDHKSDSYTAAGADPGAGINKITTLGMLDLVQARTSILEEIQS